MQEKPNLCKECKWCSVNFKRGKIVVADSFSERLPFGFWLCHNPSFDLFCNVIDGERPTCVQMRGQIYDSEKPSKTFEYEKESACKFIGVYFEPKEEK